MNGETDDSKVTERHTEVYYYGRSLFEAVDSFGLEMRPKMKVHHVLNKIMLFNEFTTYFNQPINATTSMNTVKNVSRGGIILILKSASAYRINTVKVPKYMNVSWISDLPDDA
eukprot:123616_1